MMPRQTFIVLLFMSVLACSCVKYIGYPEGSLVPTTSQGLPASAIQTGITPVTPQASHSQEPSITQQTSSSQVETEPTAPNQPPARNQPTATPSEVSPTPDLAQIPHDTLQWVSPDGQWQVETVIAVPASAEGNGTADQFYRRVTLSDSAGSHQYTIQDGWSPWGLGATTPQVWRWSRDGSSVLLVDSGVPDGCSAYGYSENLRRVSLSTGEVVEVAPDVYGAFALSPDETLLAYFSGSQLIVRDLLSSQETQIPFGAEQFGWSAGDIVWSPDGSVLAFSSVQDPCGGKAAGIFYLDRSSSLLEPLVINDRLFHLLDWPDPNRIRMADESGSHWWLDIDNGQITPANPDTP
jgi:hypothetical protein